MYYYHSPKECQVWKGRGGYRQYKCPSFEILVKRLGGPPEIKNFVELKEPRGHGYIFYENKKKIKQSKEKRELLILNREKEIYLKVDVKGDFNPYDYLETGEDD